MSEDDDPYRIEVHDACGLVSLEADRIRQAVRACLDRCGAQTCELSVAIVNDAEIARLNRRFRDRPEATDVLSFDLRDGERPGHVDGEVVVSAETAARRAGRDGRAPAAELLLYVVHGCLHLGGYDDQTRAESTRMHAAENEIMAALGCGAVFGEVQP